MNKIKKIEQLLKQWEACTPPDEDIHGIISIKKCKGGVIALEQALAILKEPSNTQLKTDACECPQGSLCEFFTKSEQCRYGKI